VIPVELLAAVKECQPGDIPALLAALSERAGKDTLHRHYMDLLGEQSDSGPVFEIASAPDLILRVGDPPPMLVDRLIPQNSLVLLAGKPKYGKSFAALDLARSVTHGEPVWGSYTVNKPGPVLYLAMEDGDYEVVNRLLKHGVRAIDPPDAPSRRLLISVTSACLTQVSALAELRRHLQEIQPVLLIVDTAREALRIKDWSDPGSITEALRPLRELAREFCALLMVAHNRKADGSDSGDEISGSNAFTSAVDGWISATRKEDRANGNRRLSLSIQGRGGMRGETTIEMDTHTLRFHTVEPEDLAEERREHAQASKNRRFTPALDAMRRQAGGRATAAILAEELSVDVRTAQLLVNEMLQAGAVEEAGERTGGRGPRAKFYRPVELTNNEITPIRKDSLFVNSRTRSDASPTASDDEEILLL